MLQNSMIQHSVQRHNHSISSLIERSELESTGDLLGGVGNGQFISYADGYEMNLIEQENKDNTLNKLCVKRELISKAIEVKQKPPGHRKFTNPIMLKVAKA